MLNNKKGILNFFSYLLADAVVFSRDIGLRSTSGQIIFHVYDFPE